MNSTMSIEYATTDPDSFLARFAGRMGMKGYDATKPMHIAECNRDFVWPEALQKGLIVSVLGGFPIPTITECNNAVVDGGNRATTLAKFRNDELVIEHANFTGTFSEMAQTRPDLVRMWDRCKINRMIVTGATPDQMSDVYENLNKGVSLTHGQLLKNRLHYPLVGMAMAMLGRTQDIVFPLAALLARAWKSKHGKASKGLGEVSLVFQVLVSALFGSAHYHASFFNHINYIMGKTMNDIHTNMRNLEFILNTIVKADTENVASPTRKAACFKRFIGAMIFDFHSKKLTTEQYEAKWVRFLQDAYNVLNAEQLTKLTDAGNKRGVLSTRLERVSENVTSYLAGAPIPQGAAGDAETDDSMDDE